MVVLRITSFIVLFLSAIFLPCPMAATLAVVLMAMFSWFGEAILVGLALGALYGSSGKGSLFFAFFAASFAAGLLVEEFFKKLITQENIISRTLIALSGGATIALFWLVFKLTLNLYVPN